MMNTSDAHPVDKRLEIEQERKRVFLEPYYKTLFRISHQLARQENPDKVFNCLTKGLIELPFITGVLLLDRDGLTIASSRDDYSKGATSLSMRLAGYENQFNTQSFNTPIRLNSDSSREIHIPKDIRKILRKAGCASVAIFPVDPHDRLEALIFVGSRNNRGLNPAVVREISNLVWVTSKTLEKIQRLDELGQHITKFRTIMALRKEIFSIKDPVKLYDKICQHINNLLGMVQSQIASYDPVKQHITVLHKHPKSNPDRFPSAPYPLGRDPISFIIRTSQPLMLLGDLENQAAELGIHFHEQTPKSWMGIPLFVGNEIIGVITVQDMIQNQRFNTNDMTLLTTTAIEFAVALRDIHFGRKANHKHHKAHLVTDIVSNVRASTNIETILRTAIRELTRGLEATEGVITLEIEE